MLMSPRYFREVMTALCDVGKISKQKERQLAAKDAQNCRGITCIRSDLGLKQPPGVQSSTSNNRECGLRCFELQVEVQGEGCPSCDCS
eukprot:751237-Hanusia_phi.AAC.3